MVIWSTTSFSKIFDGVGIIEMGWKCSSDFSWSTLGIGLILASFHASGKLYFLIQLLIIVVMGSAMDSATILVNLTRIPLGQVHVSDLNNFSIHRTLPWSTSQSLKLAGLSSGRDSIGSSRREDKSLLKGKVLSAVQAKNEFNLSGSCCKGCWLGFSMGWIIRHSSFGL